MIEKVNSLTQELNKNLTTKINDFISLNSGFFILQLLFDKRA